jgi:quercetin dioxygenase-like cupin family protein
MFQKQDESGFRKLMEGIEQKTVVYGAKTSLSKFRLKKGTLLPRHAHPNEQTGYLLEGRIRFVIGTETHDAAPGDCWCIPENVEHSAEILEDAVAFEVFSPIREDYLPKKP